MTRAELYALVWEMPTGHVAKRVGISHARLRKICLDYHIPLPPPGHWTKLAHGKSIERPSLPQPPTFLSKINSALRRLGEIPLQIAETQIDDFDLKFEEPPPAGEGLHPCAGLLATAMSGAPVDDDGFLVIDVATLPTVRVGLPSAARTVRLLDSLVRTFLQRGHHVVERDEGFRLVVEDEVFQLKIYETRDKLKHGPMAETLLRETLHPRSAESPAALQPGGHAHPPQWTYRPSGRLCLAIVDPRSFRWSGRNLVGQWHDRPDRPLERSFGDAVAACVAAAGIIRHCRSVVEEQNGRDAAAARQREVAQAEQEQARRQTEFLLEKADAYARFLDARRFAEFLAPRTDRAGTEPVDKMARALTEFVAELEKSLGRDALNEELLRHRLFLEN